MLVLLDFLSLLEMGSMLQINSSVSSSSEKNPSSSIIIKLIIYITSVSNPKLAVFSCSNHKWQGRLPLATQSIPSLPSRKTVHTWLHSSQLLQQYVWSGRETSLLIFRDHSCSSADHLMPNPRCILHQLKEFFWFGIFTRTSTNIQRIHCSTYRFLRASYLLQSCEASLLSPLFIFLVSTFSCRKPCRSEII